MSDPPDYTPNALPCSANGSDTENLFPEPYVAVEQFKRRFFIQKRPGRVDTPSLEPHAHEGKAQDWDVSSAQTLLFHYTGTCKNLTINLKLPFVL